MADVLLINPKINKKDRKYWLKGPPLNLLRLASTLMEGGFSVKIIDFRIENSYNELERQLKKGPLCVGMGVDTGPQIKYGLEVSRYVKSFDIPVVWGGRHPTADPYPTIRNEYIDFIVKGEGEYKFLELVKSLERKKDFSKIRGIIFKKDKKIIETSNAPLPNLEKLPDMPYKLIDMNQYKQTAINCKGDLLVPFETSRGCPFTCNFCPSNPSWRVISSEKIIKDIKNIVDTLKIKDFVFVDKNFCTSQKRNKEFIYQIKKEKLDIRFTAATTINYLSMIDIEFLKQLKKVGMFGGLGCVLSVESGSQRILDRVNKPIKLDQVPKVADKLKKAGINPAYSLMVGFPYETIDDIKKTFLLAIKLLLQEKNTFVSVARLLPVPSTKILEDCIKKGFKRPQKLEEWIYVSNFWKSPNTWIDKDVQLFMKRYEYVSTFGRSRLDQDIFHNYLLNFFGRLLRYRIKKDHYRFNIEEKLHNMFQRFMISDENRIYC